VLQEVAAQPVHELELLEEEGRDMNEWEPTLKAQALINFCTSFWPQ